MRFADFGHAGLDIIELFPPRVPFGVKPRFNTLLLKAVVRFGPVRKKVCLPIDFDKSWSGSWAAMVRVELRGALAPLWRTA
jgi:hypothetical protein